MNIRTDPKDRTNELLDVAVRLAQEGSWRGLTHAAIAQAAGVSNGLVVMRLGTKTELLRSVMRRAVDRGLVPIVAQGLAAGDRQAKRAGAELRKAAAEYVRTA